ncbi:MAG: DUF1499 domain-containing protein [Pseudomonadota bacterium]
MIKILGYGLALIVTLGVVAWLWVNFMPVDAERWHIDPTTATRSTSPNSFVSAPSGSTTAKIDVEAAVFDRTPAELLAQFSAIALASPRVTELTFGDRDYRTFVQRTPLVGFTDYISVKAVAVEGGASLIIFSRSQYGYSDWGVNRKRVEEWLSGL